MCSFFLNALNKVLTEYDHKIELCKTSFEVDHDVVDISNEVPDPEVLDHYVYDPQFSAAQKLRAFDLHIQTSYESLGKGGRNVTFDGKVAKFFVATLNLNRHDMYIFSLECR